MRKATFFDVKVNPFTKTAHIEITCKDGSKEECEWNFDQFDEWYAIECADGVFDMHIHYDDILSFNAYPVINGHADTSLEGQCMTSERLTIVLQEDMEALEKIAVQIPLKVMDEVVVSRLDTWDGVMRLEVNPKTIYPNVLVKEFDSNEFLNIYTYKDGI